MLQLHLKHGFPCPLRSRVIGKWITGERPGVTFAPEAIHECIHALDGWVAVEFRRQQSYKFAEGLLEEWMVISRLKMCPRVFEVSYVRRMAGFPVAHQLHHRNLIQHEVRKRRRVEVIRSGHLDTESKPLVVLLCQVNCMPQGFGEVEAT